MYSDDMNVIQITCNLIFHKHTKHIEIDRDFTRDHFQHETIYQLTLYYFSMQIAFVF